MWYTSTAVSTGSLVRQLPTAYHRKQRFFFRRYITGEFCYTTLPTTSMAPENRPGPKKKLVFQLPTPTFQGLCQFWWGYILFGCIVSTNHEHSNLRSVQLLPGISHPQSCDVFSDFESSKQNSWEEVLTSIVMSFFLTSFQSQTQTGIWGPKFMGFRSPYFRYRCSTCLQVVPPQTACFWWSFECCQKTGGNLFDRCATFEGWEGLLGWGCWGRCYPTWN